MPRGQIEHRRHFALLRAAAHQIGPPAPAEHEAERVQQDRLAGPGLPGQHVQARPELDLQPVDDQDVADFKAAQHLRLTRTPRQRDDTKPGSEPLALDRLTVDRHQPAVAGRLQQQTLAGQQRECVLIPRRRLVVVTQDRAGGLRLVDQPKRQVAFHQAVQRLGRVAGGLEILDHHAEPVDRGSVVTALQVEAADFHLLAGEMIEGEVEFQDRRSGVFAVGIALDHRAQCLQRLEGQALVAAHIVDLVIVAERQQILGIGGVFVGGIEIDVALRGGCGCSRSRGPRGRNRPA